MEIAILTEKMREGVSESYVLSRSFFREFYCTIFQMLTHHTSNGCRIGFRECRARVLPARSLS